MRAWNRLSNNFVRGATKPRRYADGGNLFLQVAQGGSKAWVFAYQRNGVIRNMGLGSVRSVPLALARELAAQAREQLARNVDPIDARQATALDQKAARAKLTTFRQCAETPQRKRLSLLNKAIKHLEALQEALHNIGHSRLQIISIQTSIR